MVVVNLYPFEKTAAKPGVSFEELIENIDIGGPSMIRSAAKNFEDVTVLVDAADYAAVLEELRRTTAAKSHARRAPAWRARPSPPRRPTTAPFPRPCRHWRTAELPENLHLNYRKSMDLRYGENPHQKAALYRNPAAAGRGLAAARATSGQGTVVQQPGGPGSGMAAGLASLTCPRPSSSSIPIPAGWPRPRRWRTAIRRALEVDPVSAFGSVIAFNRALDGPAAEALSKLFVEAVVAPGFDAAALERLSAKKNLRLVDMSAASGDDYGLQLKAVGGGLLVQTPDNLPIEAGRWKCATERQPTPAEMEALLFAWRIVKHVKSNAIVYARPGVLVGVGAGQMSRVDSVKLGATKARELKHSLEGTVLASDAFFPFPDGVEEAARVGVTAIVQPGGSVRDNEIIAAANAHGLAMLLTGVRHFSH